MDERAWASDDKLSPVFDWVKPAKKLIDEIVGIAAERRRYKNIPRVAPVTARKECNMADFESIVRNHVGEDGNIPSEAIAKLVKAISTAVGNEFVEKSRYKAKLEEIDALTEEKQTAQDSATTAEKWKTKYQALKDDFDAYKTEQTKKESHAAKEKAYRALLKDAGVSEKRLESVLKVSDVDSVELDEKGTIKEADKLAESIKSEWADFITTTETRGASTSNPPANNNGGAMTKADIYKKDDHGHYVLSAAERQKALMENQIL